MNLPFTVDQFLSVFEQYNHAVWPFQLVLNVLALTTLAVSLKPFNSSSKLVSACLAFLWLWIGAAYHLAFFASINPAAHVFGALNIIQGCVFLFYGVIRSKLSFAFRANRYTAIGALFIIYALLLYPTLGYFLGHEYPKSPTFGLPCPTTIFTFGILLWTNAKLPKVVLAIPLLWSGIGFSAALTLGRMNKPEVGVGHAA
jgi:hypothetical protein